MAQTPAPPSAFEDEDWGQEVWDAVSTLVKAGVTPELYERWVANDSEPFAPTPMGWTTQIYVNANRDDSKPSNDGIPKQRN